MGLLDQLLEKKDVLAYIDFRIKSLKYDLSKAILNAVPKDREYIRERFNGRILELEELRIIIHDGTIAVKCQSKFYAQRTSDKVNKTKYLRLGYKSSHQEDK